jgi:SAM-dependent methyltransferase
MSTGYAVAYALGLTPWEKAGVAGTEQLHTLIEREEADLGGPGRALDLGCGSGGHAVALAARGWDVTGVDQIGRALKRARKRAAEQSVNVRFVQGDVTRLDPQQVGTGFQFFLDVGCLHGLDEAGQVAMGRSVTALAAPAATALLLAFQPGAAPRPLPRGADAASLERAFPGWRVVDAGSAETGGMPAPLRKAAPQWYRLRREV